MPKGPPPAPVGLDVPQPQRGTYTQPMVMPNPMGGFMMAPAPLMMNRGVPMAPPLPGYGKMPIQVGPPLAPFGVPGALPMGFPQATVPMQQPQSLQPPQPRSQQQNQGRGGRGFGNSRGGRGGNRNGFNNQQRDDGAGSPATPVARREPDQDLIKQFASRYEMQEEARSTSNHEMLNASECCDVIEANDITFIVTDTGTGKSSLIPKELIRRGAHVVSSQPRRTAAINLANRVSDLLGEKVGESVGYCVRGEKIGSDKLPLMYMTSYTVFLHVISHPNDLIYTHFIIDEFHERQADVEVLLSLLKLARQQRNIPIKIILMSASVELEMWKNFFTGLSVGEYNTCKPRYPVHEYYAEEVCRFVGAQLRPVEKNDRVHSLDFKNATYLVQQMLTFLAQNTAPQHCALVFLPGRTNVEQMATWIETHHPEQLEPIQWYRDVELPAIQAAVAREATSKKKVYLATDIAEVSVTIPDVVFVIDSGTTKKPRINAKNKNTVAFPPLELLWCSRSAVAQRKGRVGRVQQGFFFTMIQEAQLPFLPDMEPQISNTRINELSLHVLEIAGNPLAVFNLGRTHPKKESVELSINVLMDWGCAIPASNPVSAAESMDNKDAKPWTETILSHPANTTLGGATFVTPVKGIIIQHLPLNIECAQIVYQGLMFGLESLMILASAIASIGTPFYAFAESNQEAKSLEVRNIVKSWIDKFSHGTKSDVVAAIEATLQYKELQLSGTTVEGEEEWCKERSLSRFRLQNILTLEKQVTSQLNEQLSFREIQDLDVLRDQLKKHAWAVGLLICASHLERGIYVTKNQADQQRDRTAGPSIFLGLNAQKDEFVASLVAWDLNKVVIPLSMQLRYDRLLGSFSTELTPQQYDLLLLLFVHDLVLESKSPNQALFGVELQGQKLAFECDGKAANMIIEFRKLYALKTRVIRVLTENKTTTCDNVAAINDLAIALLGKVGKPAVPIPGIDSLSSKLLQALEFLFGQLVGKLSCKTYNGPFAPTHHSVLLSTSAEVEVLPSWVPLPPLSQPEPPATPAESVVAQSPTVPLTPLMPSSEMS